MQFSPGLEFHILEICLANRVSVQQLFPPLLARLWHTVSPPLSVHHLAGLFKEYAFFFYCEEVIGGVHCDLCEILFHSWFALQ